MGFLYDGGQGMNSYPARQTYTACSAEAGIASKDAPTAFSATAACVNIFNTASAAADNRVIVPRKLELLVRAANSNATDFRLHFFIDKGRRWASVGTLLVNFPMSGSEDSRHAHEAGKAEVYVGELTLSAATASERVIWRSWVQNEIFVAQDKITVVFGSDTEELQAADPEMTVAHVPPMFIGPGYNLSIHEVSAAMTADPKFCYQLWWDEIETGGSFPAYPGVD